MLKRISILAFMLSVTILSSCGDSDSGSQVSKSYFVAIEGSSLTEPSLGLEEVTSLLVEPQIKLASDGSGELLLSTNCGAWVVEFVEALIQQSKIPIVELIEVETLPSGIRELSRTGFLNSSFKKTELRGENGQASGNFVLKFDSQQQLEESGLFSVSRSSVNHPNNTFPCIHFYLKLDGIQGDCTSQGHEGFIELLQYVFSHTAVDSRSDERQAQVEFSFSAVVGQWTSALIDASDQGKTIETGLLELTRATDEGEQVRLSVNMEKIVILGTQSAGSENSTGPTLHAELTPSRIAIHYSTSDSDDTTDGNLASDWHSNP